MSNTLTGETRTGLQGWNTRDLLVTAVIAIVFGFLMMGVDYLSAVLMGINPALTSIVSGFYFLPMIMAMYIVRRPGTAILAITIVNLARMTYSPFGWAEALMTILFVSCGEIPFLITRYRDYRLYILFASGGLVGLLSYGSMAAFGLFAGFSVTVQIIIAGVFVLSGMLFGGLLAKLLADAIARTGVLNGFAIAKAAQEEI